MHLVEILDFNTDLAHFWRKLTQNPLWFSKLKDMKKIILSCSNFNELYVQAQDKVAKIESNKTVDYGEINKR